MKFTQTGTFRENFLGESTTINLSEKIDDLLLKKFDYLIVFIAKENPKILSDYIKNLTEKFQGLVDDNHTINPSPEIEEKFKKYENLNQYLDLKNASLNYLLHLLQIESQEVWENDELEITMRALIQAWTFPPYYLLLTLTEVIDREEALKLFKKFITNYFLDNRSPNRDEDFSLDKMLEKRLSGDTSSSEWVLVHTMLEDGKYAFKNKNCPTCVDAMKDLPDTEIKYFVCCYGDYEMFRALYSDHLVLTMEHTLMQGDPYCSRVLHDTRIDYNLKHPHKEFWDNFEPGKEEEATRYYKK